MGEVTNISWAESTWTPIRARRLEIQDDGSGRERIGWHCEHASPGCIHCYSEGINKRLGTGRDFKPAHLIHKTAHGDDRGDVSIFLDEEMLKRPLRWKRGRMIFVCSMTDLFANFVTDDMIDKVFAIVAMAKHHTFQILTKRSVRMREYVNRFASGHYSSIEKHIIAMGGNPIEALDSWPLRNAWLGVSAEDQERADDRIRDLSETMAAVRFVSIEPILEPVNIAWALGAISWTIVGGESGRMARPAQLEWIRSIVRQCQAANVPVHVKQLGARPEYSGASAPGQHWPTGVTFGCDTGRGTFQVNLRHSKGGDPAEWPSDVRVQEMPA